MATRPPRETRTALPVYAQPRAFGRPSGQSHALSRHWMPRAYRCAAEDSPEALRRAALRRIARFAGRPGDEALAGLCPGSATAPLCGKVRRCSSRAEPGRVLFTPFGPGLPSPPVAQRPASPPAAPAPRPVAADTASPAATSSVTERASRARPILLARLLFRRWRRQAGERRCGLPRLLGSALSRLALAEMRCGAEAPSPRGSAGWLRLKAGRRRTARIMADKLSMRRGVVALSAWAGHAGRAARIRAIAARCLLRRAMNRLCNATGRVAEEARRVRGIAEVAAVRLVRGQVGRAMLSLSAVCAEAHRRHALATVAAARMLHRALARALRTFCHACSTQRRTAGRVATLAASTAARMLHRTVARALRTLRNACVAQRRTAGRRACLAASAAAHVLRHRLGRGLRAWRAAVDQREAVARRFAARVAVARFATIARRHDSATGGIASPSPRHALQRCF